MDEATIAGFIEALTRRKTTEADLSTILAGFAQSHHLSAAIVGWHRALIDAKWSAPQLLALDMLGGVSAFPKAPLSMLELHSALVKGLPSDTLVRLVELSSGMPLQALSTALGVSERTLHRKKNSDQPVQLTSTQSDRAFRYAEVVAKAALLLGTREDAIRWLTKEAIGLNRQRPVDLLETSAGAEMVLDLLGRLEHGVYT